MATPKKYYQLLLATLILFGLYLSSLYSYLLFHTLAELFSVIVAASIFILVWNARRFLDNGYLLLIGIAYLFVSILDLVHTLAYKGMGVFPAYDANLPTQLWIAARYLQAFSLLIAPLYLRRKLEDKRIIAAYAAGFSIVVTLVLLSTFYWKVFPDSFIEGQGLTPFKKASEYIIALIFTGAMGLLLINKRALDRSVLQFLVLSILASIGAELAFTIYIDVYGLANMAGHILKIIAFYFIYKAIIQTGFEQPYNLLFRNLKKSEEELRRAHDELEIRVQERTQALKLANEQLAQANEELRDYRHHLEELVEARTTELQAEIKERQMAEAELYKLAQFPGENPNPILRISSSGDLLYANKASLELLNYWGCQVGECVPNHLYDQVLNALMTKSRHELELPIDGRIFIVTVAPIVENGYVNMYAKDITERKRAEEKLKSYAAQLARSNRELQDFASIASHDLQEPLRKIQAFGGRLYDKYPAVLGDDGRDYIQRMKNAASRMQSMLDDLLAYSRVTTKARPLTPVDLVQVINEVISDLEVSIEETGGKVELEGLPTIDADPLQMRQLFQNLIGNALKFHQPGIPPLICISSQPISANESSQKEAFFRILIADNGIGFDEKYLDRIFLPFQRLHGHNEYKGSGMGLAICKKIVERHEGSITARSKPGQGTTFLITLPASSQVGLSE